MRVIVIVLLLALGFSPAARTQVEQPSPKVVVVSLDGAADWLVDEYLARGVLPPDGAFARMSRQGARAEAMQPINATVTAAAHVAMFTGATPERSGIIANAFLLPGAPVTAVANGFDVPLQAEAIWSAAQRQGKRVACVPGVTADAKAPARTCTNTLVYGGTEINPTLVSLRPAPADQWRYETRQFEFAKELSAVESGSLAYKDKSGATVPLYALAVDRRADGRELYNAVICDLDRDLGNGFSALLQAEQTAYVTLPFPARALGAWVRLLRWQPDLSTVTLYLGSAGAYSGSPAAYLDDLKAEIKTWAGESDRANRNRGLISERVWLDQVEQQMRQVERIVQLFHPERAGDVYVNARPGFALSSRGGPNVPLLAPSSPQPDVREALALNQQTREFLANAGPNEVNAGVHGHLSNVREMQALFFAWGPRVPRQHLGLLKSLDVAPTVAAVLGIEPPREAQGKPAFQPVR